MQITTTVENGAVYTELKCHTFKHCGSQGQHSAEFTVFSWITLNQFLHIATDLGMGPEIIDQASLFSSKVKWNGLGNMGPIGQVSSEETYPSIINNLL